MKSKSLFVLIVLITAYLPVTEAVDTNLDVSWTRTYGGTTDDFFNGMQITENGNLILMSTKEGSSQTSKIEVLGTGPNGDLKWSLSLGNESHVTNGFGLYNSYEGEYYAIGTLQNTTDLNTAIIIYSFDEEGDLVWDYSYELGTIATILSVKQSGDGVIMILTKHLELNSDPEAPEEGFEAIHVISLTGELVWEYISTDSEEGWGTIIDIAAISSTRYAFVAYNSSLEGGLTSLVGLNANLDIFEWGIQWEYDTDHGFYQLTTTSYSAFMLISYNEPEAGELYYSFEVFSNIGGLKWRGSTAERYCDEGGIVVKPISESTIYGCSSGGSMILGHHLRNGTLDVDEVFQILESGLEYTFLELLSRTGADPRYIVTSSVVDPNPGPEGVENAIWILEIDPNGDKRREAIVELDTRSSILEGRFNIINQFDQYYLAYDYIEGSTVQNRQIQLVMVDMAQISYTSPDTNLVKPRLTTEEFKIHFTSLSLLVMNLVVLTRFWRKSKYMGT